MANLSETVHQGLDALLKLKDTQRALVATITNGQLVIQSIHSLQASELDQASPVTTVLAQVHKQAKGLLVLDADQELLLSSLPEERRQELRSAVCVPVLGEADKLLGILYADSRARVGNFTYGDLNSLQAEAQQLAPRLAASLAELARGKPKTEEPVVNTRTLTVVGVLLVAALLWFVVGVIFSGPKKKVETESVGVARAGPTIVATSFISMLARGDYEYIDHVLSSGMNRRWPPEKLVPQLKSWKQNSDNRTDLQYRHVRPGTGIVIVNKAEVIVDPRSMTDHLDPDSPAARNYWKFFLVKEGDSWKIDRMESAPASFRQSVVKGGKHPIMRPAIQPTSVPLPASSP